MAPDLYPRRSWAAWLVGWIIGLVLLAAVVEAVVQMLRPLLPWMALGALMLTAFIVWWRSRRYW